jgi:hypothetical protein
VGEERRERKERRNTGKRRERSECRKCQRTCIDEVREERRETGHQRLSMVRQSPYDCFDADLYCQTTLSTHRRIGDSDYDSYSQ